jgi:hypothetical protein
MAYCVSATAALCVGWVGAMAYHSKTSTGGQYCCIVWCITDMLGWLADVPISSLAGFLQQANTINRLLQWGIQVVGVLMGVQSEMYRQEES